MTAKRPLILRGEQIVKQHTFEKQLRNLLSEVGCNTLKDVSGTYWVFDLSQSYWYDLGCLLWLVSLLHTLRRQGNEIQIVLPEPSETDSKASNVWDFLIRWRFFEALSKCVDDPVNLLKPKQVPYMLRGSKYAMPVRNASEGGDTFQHTLRMLEITTIRADQDEKTTKNDMETFLKGFHDWIIEGALRLLCGWDEKMTTWFQQMVVREGITNAVMHAQGSFVTLAMRLDKRNLTLAIADNGIGIPETLRRAFRDSGVRADLVKSSDVELIKFFTEPEIVLDSRLIRMSFEKGITSRPGHAGVGLHYLKSLVLHHGGELRVRSGQACVDFTQTKEKSIDDMLVSPGTVIRIQTPLKTKHDARAVD